MLLFVVEGKTKRIYEQFPAVAKKRSGVKITRPWIFE